MNRRRILLLVFVLWICYTIIFSVVKVPPQAQVDRWHLDLIFHFTAYLVMTLLGRSLIGGWALLLALVVAAGTELAQSRLPYRTASWLDFGVNLAGIALGLLLFWIARRRSARNDK